MANFTTIQDVWTEFDSLCDESPAWDRDELQAKIKTRFPGRTYADLTPEDVESLVEEMRNEVPGAFSLSDLDPNTFENRGCNFGQIWDACCSPIYRVVDEEGNNVADGQVRHFLGRHWLYVDDTDGYEIMDQDAVDNLILTNP